MPTIVAQIQRLEQQLQDCQQRQSKIEVKLRHCPEAERERLEQEEEEVVEEVARMEEQLLSLRKENRRTMWVSVFIFSLLAALYYLFTSTPLINT